MKEFIDMMMKDYHQEHFTKQEWVKYGIVIPSLLIIACVLF